MFPSKGLGHVVQHEERRIFAGFDFTINHMLPLPRRTACVNTCQLVCDIITTRTYQIQKDGDSFQQGEKENK